MAKTKIYRHPKFHLRRVGLFSALLVSVLLVRFDAGNSIAVTTDGPQVLAYATEMSRSALFSATNAARAANGLGAFKLDSQLNNSAQAKAQHMKTKDYWAHVAPDGTQPWYFFDQAGYAYVRAGENLAYGFSTSQSTVNGWMASPGHKANILGDYVDVGFGIVNAPNFVGDGQQTIVVAHYGSRGGSAPPLVTKKTTTKKSSTPKTEAATSSPTTQQPSSAPSNPTPTATPTKEQPAKKKPAPKKEVVKKEPQESAAPIASPVQVAEPKNISLAGLLAEQRAPIIALASMTFLSMTAVGYAFTHKAAFQHAFATGERYVMRHPSVDAVVVAGAVVAVMVTSYGRIG